jgi:hypothetical protein
MLFNKAALVVEASKQVFARDEHVVGFVHWGDAPLFAFGLGLLFAAWLADEVAVLGTFFTNAVDFATEAVTVLGDNLTRCQNVVACCLHIDSCG